MPGIINRFNPPILINCYRKSIEIEVTEKNNFLSYYRLTKINGNR